MSLDLRTPNSFWASLIVEELVRLGVDRFCISPGSRSTPLTVAAARHPRARTTVHVDERGSAFFALGHARATGRPAVWITTSGTAVANGLPAVVEAAQDGVPLLALTADRPPELRATSANQTIDQVGIFGTAVRWFVDVPCPTEAVDPAFVLTTVDQAVARTLVPPGPVHVNCMFREPLAPRPTDFDPDPHLVGLGRWLDADTPYTASAPAHRAPDAAAVSTLAERRRTVRRGLIVAGGLRDRRDAEAVRGLARTLGWPLFPDVRSGLRLGPADAPLVPAYDQLLANEVFRDRMRPEMTLYFGRPAVSKRLLQFLDTARPDPFVVIDPGPARIDPTHQVTHRFETDVAAFADALRAALDEPAAAPDLDDFGAAWTRALDAHLNDLPDLTEPGVARLLSRHLPADHALVVGNSMPVRDVDAFAATGGPAVPVFANRGASGIDGTIATAAGVAAGRGTPVTLLLGDLAALHDLNALALLRDHPVTAVVVNNDGGGIFSFLPIAEHETVFEPYFGTPHGLTFEAAAALYGLPYDRPETPEAFVDAYRQAATSGRSALLEVQTDRTANHALHRALLDLAAGLDLDD